MIVIKQNICQNICCYLQAGIDGIVVLENWSRRKTPMKAIQDNIIITCCPVDLINQDVAYRFLQNKYSFTILILGANNYNVAHCYQYITTN